MLPQLLKKINNKEAIIAVVGLGYVGLPLLLCFAEKGYRVLGVDVDTVKNETLSEGRSYLKHIPSERIQAVLPYVRTTSDFSMLADADAIILCVPTPLNRYREPDLSFVVQTMESILPFLRKGQFISLESTTYPGTTEEELKTRIEAQGFKVGEDVFLAFSPEREDPGNPNFSTADIPKVCGADTSACREVAEAVYGSVVKKVVNVSSTRAAEMTKLLENIHRAVNIGLVNEMKVVADRMGLDIYEVIDAASTKPFGFVPYYPGPGIGGHCIPIDPFYLTWKAREFGLHTRFIELAGEVNGHMPKWVVHKITDALNDQGKSLKNSQILVLGISYKRDIDDMRESPSVEIMELLREKGAVVSYSDPHVLKFPRMRHHHLDLESLPITAELIASFDCVVLTTAHSQFDYALIAQNAKLLIDTRGAFRAYRAPHIVSA